MEKSISINTHSSIKITAANKVIYVDPYKIRKKSKDADIILITHNHYDHFDLTSISKIKKDSTIIVMPASCLKEFKDISNDLNLDNYLGVIPNKQYEVDGIHIETTYSYNEHKNYHPKDNNWVGYIVALENERLYIAGDTDFVQELTKINCDIALVPIGGTYTMDLEQAANLVNTIKPKVVIPTHYGSIVGEKSLGNEFKKIVNEDIECQTLIK